ncbi:hypothetical protein [Paraburkholderia sp.]
MSNTLESAARREKVAGHHGKGCKAGKTRNPGLQREPGQKTNSFIK